MNEVVQEFLTESHELLAKFDLDLVILERNPTEPRPLARLCSKMHTIRGTAGFMGFTNLQRLAHDAENLIMRMRNGDVRYREAIGKVLSRASDTIRRSFDVIERTEGEGLDDYADLIRRLNDMR